MLQGARHCIICLERCHPFPSLDSMHFCCTHILATKKGPKLVASDAQEPSKLARAPSRRAIVGLARGQTVLN